MRIRDHILTLLEQGPMSVAEMRAVIPHTAHNTIGSEVSRLMADGVLRAERFCNGRRGGFKLYRLAAGQVKRAA